MRSLPNLMIDSPDVTPLDDHDESTAPTADPRPDGLRRAESLVVVNTGNGKGKSSSAFGMMVRAVARDWDVAVVQFIKSGNWNVGEEKVGRQLGVDWYAFGDGFTWDWSPAQRRYIMRWRWTIELRPMTASAQHADSILRELVAMLRPMDAATAEASRAAYEKMWRDVPENLRAYLRSYTVTGTCPNESSEGTS